jgi:hypothetical protein
MSDSSDSARTTQWKTLLLQSPPRPLPTSNLDLEALELSEDADETTDLERSMIAYYRQEI